MMKIAIISTLRDFTKKENMMYMFKVYGFPDWALAVDNNKENERPPKSPPPPDLKWQIKYMINKSLKHTFKSFWENDLTNVENGLKNYPVRTHLEKTIGQTVKFKSLNDGLGHPAVLGIEPFNEPHPGVISKKDFEVKFLMDFYRKIDRLSYHIHSDINYKTQFESKSG
jgi:hypothetical protein